MRKGKINFVVIGAQKAGTTWLYSRLSELPDFSMPPIKELHYFDRDKKYPSPTELRKTYLINRLININWIKRTARIYLKLLKAKEYKNLRWYFKWYLSNFNDKWYLSLFHNLLGITGDISPSYSIINEEDVKKMHEAIPDVKVIFMLRNPIDRAWSNYRFGLRFCNKEFIASQNINDMIKFFNSDAQELRSNYTRTIDLFSKYYPKENILLGFYDAIAEQPKNLLHNIVEFLGGDTSNIEEKCEIKEINNISLKMEMPCEVREFLSQKYKPLLADLSNRYGEYCTRWAQDSPENNKSFTLLSPTLKLEE